MKPVYCLCKKKDEQLEEKKQEHDVEIGELIESQYLPEMPALFQKADREKQQLLQALQPKRQ
ncbi:hypothetical protein BpHYR1_018925 [Brachionus plicatilis]|uniref:Uncharacterized protein n=1 Tax=Brachionus plicatilis TaxID=10195 RepID=A0A3M7S6U7_BRAPC|nr:hypothetical protein BpHYR1_018925 [Brachionus plicatilis]